MGELFTSDRLQIKPHQESYFREEIFVSEFDAQRAGLSATEQPFCIFAIEALIPDLPDQEFAVRLVVKPNLEPGAILMNQHFLDSAGFSVDDMRPWTIKSASNIVPIREAVIELTVEQGNIEREIRNLQRRNLFVNRCLLIQPNQTITDLKLSMDRGYFNFRSIQPAPETIRSNSILFFDKNTSLNLFVPHRKSGVDMVIVVDASGSMNLCDYVGTDGRPRTRLQGVREALEILLQRRLTSGSRVSSIAIVVFGANTQMLYPPDCAMVELKSQAQVQDMQRSIRDLSEMGLQRRGVDPFVRG
jgi:von Willebrand factor type A domain